MRQATTISAAVSHSIGYRSSYGSSGCSGCCSLRYGSSGCSGSRFLRRWIWSSNLLSASSCARRFFLSWTIPSLIGGMALTITQATTPMAMPGSPKSCKNGNNPASVKGLLGKCFYPEKINSAAKLSALITWAVKVPLNGLENSSAHSRATGVHGRGRHLAIPVVDHSNMTRSNNPLRSPYSDPPTSPTTNYLESPPPPLTGHWSGLVVTI